MKTVRCCGIAADQMERYWEGIAIANRASYNDSSRPAMLWAINRPRTSLRFIILDNGAHFSVLGASAWYWMEPKMQNILGETSKKSTSIKHKSHNILLFPQNKEKHAMLLNAAEPAKLSRPLGQKVHALDSTRAARGFRLQSSYNQLIIVALLHKQILRSNLSQIICSISILFHFLCSIWSAQSGDWSITWWRQKN